MKSISIPVNNYNIDVATPEQRWRNSINKDIKGLKNKPRNSQSIPNINIKLQKIDSTQEQTLLTATSGFFSTSFVQFFELLPSPLIHFKSSLIRDITMNIAVSSYAPDTGGYSPVVGRTSFTIDFYVSLVLLDATNGNILTAFTDGLFVSNALMTIPFTFSIPSSDPLKFTIESPKSFRLSETVTRLTDVVTSAPNFTTNPTKITQAQYNKMTNQNNFLCGFVGFNNSQYNALSSANKDQFDDLFRLGIGGSQQLFGVGVDLSLSYFGVGATFESTQN
jgi:hypothetical protein